MVIWNYYPDVVPMRCNCYQYNMFWKTLNLNYLQLTQWLCLPCIDTQINGTIYNLNKVIIYWKSQGSWRETSKRQKQHTIANEVVKTGCLIFQCDWTTSNTWKFLIETQSSMYVNHAPCPFDAVEAHITILAKKKWEYEETLPINKTCSGPRPSLKLPWTSRTLCHQYCKKPSTSS